MRFILLQKENDAIAALLYRLEGQNLLMWYHHRYGVGGKLKAPSC